MTFYSDTSFEPNTSIGYLVRRAHQMSVAGLEAIFEEEGLTGVQWSALMLICVGMSMTGAAIARDLSYDKGATTRLVDTLEARGWVTRQRCTADRRVVKLKATAAGLALALRCKRRVIARWNEWLADWGGEDIETTIRLLQRLCGTLEAATLPAVRA